jgi:hypothetical protein
MPSEIVPAPEAVEDLEGLKPMFGAKFRWRSSATCGTSHER